MRLTPQQSQLEVESSSPESLAPTTPVHNANGTKKRTINVELSGRSALHLANAVYDDCYAKLPGVPSMVDPLHADVHSPSSPCIRSCPDASDRPTSAIQADLRSEERTLDDELLDFVEDPETLRSIDIKLPPRHTLEPDVSIAMAVLNNELSPPLQPGKSGMVESGTATESTGNEGPLTPADVLKQNDNESPAEDVIEVLVEGEAAKDPYRAPSLTQLDTRLRSGLTKFVFLAPAEPGPVRGALVTRACPSSQRSDTGPNGGASCKVDDRASTGRKDEAEATKSPLQSAPLRSGAEVRDPDNGTIAPKEACLISPSGYTSATSQREESVHSMGIAELVGSSSTSSLQREPSAPAAGPEDERLCSRHMSLPEQPVVTADRFYGNVACSSTDHLKTIVARMAVPIEVANIQARVMVDCACQADLMAWPCATPSCKKHSERSLASRHCLGQVEKFEVLEKPNLSHSSTCVNASGSPLCWECSFERRRQVVRSRKQRAKARRHLQRFEVKAGSVSTGHGARDVSGKRKLDADVSGEVLEPPAKRRLNIEAASCGLLLTNPISYQLVQANSVTPESPEKTSQQANEPPTSIRTPVMSKRRLPIEAQPTSKTCCVETASSSTQTEETLQRREKSVSSCSTPQRSSSRHASKTPSPLRAVQTLSETPPSSPPPLSLTVGREASIRSAGTTPSQCQPPSPTRTNVLMEQRPTSVTAQSQSHHDNHVFSTLDASKNPHVDTKKLDPVPLHFCECGRDLARFAEKLLCKTCMNEQYWQLLAEHEAGNAAACDDFAGNTAHNTPHSTELCFVCSKLVAFDEHGLCIPCANPMVSGERDAAKRQRRNKKRRDQSGEQSRAHMDKQVPASAMDLMVDVAVSAKQMKRTPLKGILKRR